jgi:pyridoxal phosphate enzyme (YggS family)
MITSSIATRIEQVRERIAVAAEKSGRKTEDITLVAVSKTVPVEALQEAVAAGVTEFGENYVQEARAKIPLLEESYKTTDICIHWHLIGHLQSNKVKYTIELFSLIHSVDNYQLMKEIDRQSAKKGKIQEVLLEVDMTDIPTRRGVGIKEFPQLLEQTIAFPHVMLRGIMGIAPVVEASDEARAYFSGLRCLWETLPAEHRQVLSMGMSGDFEAAISEGATHVRIGSAIFGARPVVR